MAKTDVTLNVLGLDVKVPKKWLKDGEDAAVEKVIALREQFAKDQMEHGFDKAVELHEQRMSS